MATVKLLGFRGVLGFPLFSQYLLWLANWAAQSANGHLVTAPITCTPQKSYSKIEIIIVF
jgi:hypothetical protein